MHERGRASRLIHNRRVVYNCIPALRSEFCAPIYWSNNSDFIRLCWFTALAEPMLGMRFALSLSS